MTLLYLPLFRLHHLADIDKVLFRSPFILRPDGLSPAAAQVLSLVQGAGEPLSPYVIGDRLLVSRGTVIWLVDSLEQSRLVRRKARPADQRTVLVEVTDKAVQLLREYRPQMHQLDGDLVAELRSAEQETLLTLLGRIQVRLNRWSSDATGVLLGKVREKGVPADGPRGSGDAGQN